MSSILPFVVVAVVLAVVASMALGAAAQPATESDGNRRDPWRDRLGPVLQWGARSARDARRWLVAGLVTSGRWWRERRARRRAARSDRRARRRTERALEAPVAPPATTPTAPASASHGETIVPLHPEGVVTTALRVKPDVALAETMGEDLPRRGPGLFVRFRSAVGLILLIAVLGLALAAALAAIAAAVGAALDSVVN